MDEALRAAFNDIVRRDLASEPAPACECKCNGAEPHSDRVCGRSATTMVALHRFGYCNDAPDAYGFTRPEQVDADGNICSLMCSQCARHAVSVAKAKIRQMLLQLPPALRDRPHCPSCGRPVVRPEDLVELRPL